MKPSRCLHVERMLHRSGRPQTRSKPAMRKYRPALSKNAWESRHAGRRVHTTCRESGKHVCVLCTSILMVRRRSSDVGYTCQYTMAAARQWQAGLIKGETAVVQNCDLRVNCARPARHFHRRMCVKINASELVTPTWQHDADEGENPQKHTSRHLSNPQPCRRTFQCVAAAPGSFTNDARKRGSRRRRSGVDGHNRRGGGDF